MNIEEKAAVWLQSNIDEESRQAIESLLKSDDKEELTEAFYKDLEFGTGGLRGIMGVGSNRMNKYTVGKATQGLANYLKKKFPGQELKVAIAHDSRNNSDRFAQVTADVFSANGIKVYLFDEMRPTPELSFAIRHFGCHSGVVLTASHNPKEYNGYKAYWNDGAQIVSPHDKNVIAEVQAIKSINEVKFEGKPEMVERIGKEVDEAYLQQVEKLSLSPEAVKKHSTELKIVYSALHGTGVTLVPAILERLGFKNVFLVEEQAKADGNFPTVVYPNPEEKEAMSMGLNLGHEVNADLIMATDPDADRVGIAVKNLDNEFQLLNGNQTAALIFYYMLEKWQEKGKINGKQYIVSTIVTTDLLDKIAEGFKVECYNTLTGFKNIAAVMRELENQKEYIVGGEESFGYLPGDFVRDKDAVASCAIIAEIAAFAKDKGKTIFEVLIEVYEKFGFYKERLISITKKGMKGAQEIQQMMDDFRTNPPATLAGEKVRLQLDYQKQIAKDLESGKEEPIELEKSNVLQFITDKGSKISARPSGTEPKIKFYISVNEALNSKDEFEATEQKLEQKIDQIAADLKVKA